jgi:hypothetical protein
LLIPYQKKGSCRRDALDICLHMLFKNERTVGHGTAIQTPTKFELIINLKTAKALAHRAATDAGSRRRGDRIAAFLLQCMSLLLAQSGHGRRGDRCLLSVGKADMG